MAKKRKEFNRGDIVTNPATDETGIVQTIMHPGGEATMYLIAVPKEYDGKLSALAKAMMTNGISSNRIMIDDENSVEIELLDWSDIRKG